MSFTTLYIIYSILLYILYILHAHYAYTHVYTSISYRSQEVFIFDFGAVVFWGFSRGEEAPLLKAIRLFIEHGKGNIYITESSLLLYNSDIFSYIYEHTIYMCICYCIIITV